MDYETEIASLDGKCLEEIDRCLSRKEFDRSKFMEWVEKTSPSSKRNPSAYFMAALRKAKEEGRFEKREEEIQSEERLTIQDEINEEEAYYQTLLIEMDYLSRIGARHEFTEPFDPRFEEHPSTFDGPHLGHPEYKENTFISVRREAQREKTSMREICRRKNLVWEALII